MKNSPSALAHLKNRILETVTASEHRLTRPGLEKLFPRQGRAEKTRLRAAINALVNEGALAYAYEHGCSFIEQSFGRPVRISRHVFIAPPRVCCPTEPGDVVVVIDPGDAFGTGRHPSTRLAVRGVETAMGFLGDTGTAGSDRRLLDIGTGSGVLLISALLLGLDKGLGIDREPCAVAEAGKNLQRNHLGERAVITGQDLDTINGKFSMITANLRFPSLIRYAERIGSLLDSKGVAVLSGMTVDELTAVQDACAENDMSMVWQAGEKRWSGAVFRKNQ